MSRKSTKVVNLATRKAATWLFVLPFFAAGVVPYLARIELAGLALLVFAALITRAQAVPKFAIGRICWTAIILTLILCVYLLFGSWPSPYGTQRAYDTQALVFIATYVAAAAFSVMFFEERLFESVVWRAATVVLWVGVISSVASLVTHRELLVNPAYNGLRLQGTLSEPSAWAPVIPVIMLLAWRRRAWLYVVLAAVALVLTDSPTCILVLLVTIPLYYFLTGMSHKQPLVLLALAAVGPPLLFFVQTANPDRYLNSPNAAEVAMGRLLSGIHNVETGGQVGANSRFTNTTIVIGEVRANGWMRTGAGPAADSTYFRAKYPEASAASNSNCLWTSVLFDFGEVGVAVLVVLMLRAVWRMRRHPTLAAILLPFFVAALFNSAEGSFEYVFVALGIMLFTFGWLPGLTTSSAGESWSPEPAGPSAPSSAASFTGSGRLG